MTADAVGGVWTYALDLAAALQGRGHAVTLAICGPAPSPDQLEQAADAGVSILPDELPLDWLCSDGEAVREGSDKLATLSAGYDLALLNSPALAATGGFRVPVIAVAHGEVATWWDAVGCSGDIDDAFGWLVDLIGTGLKRATRIVTPTAAYGELVRRRYELEASPVAVHNGRVPLDRASSSNEPAFALTVGRFWDRAKNIGTLDAAASLSFVPIRAVGASTGPHGERAAMANLEYLGSVAPARLGELLAARPVFASSAVYEPFGLAVLEAAQAGCPLVLADIATFRELWDGAATFVDPHDAAGFARAIERPQASGAAARKRAERYTVAAMADQMLGVIESALDHRRAA
nr:glycosyltransferase family 4 protein [Porphyrobacter sp. GA68]